MTTATTSHLTRDEMMQLTAFQLSTYAAALGVRVNVKRSKADAVARVLAYLATAESDPVGEDATELSDLSDTSHSDAPAPDDHTDMSSAPVVTADAVRAATEAGRKRREAERGKRAPQERRAFNTTERYIVGTLAHVRAPMTRAEVDKACRLRQGSIAGHAVKRAYVDLVARGVLTRTGDGAEERFAITEAGYAAYVATLDGGPVAQPIVPRWIPPAKRAA